MDIEQMKYLYIEKGLSTTQVGSQLGVSTATAQRHLRRLGLIRSISEAVKLHPHHGGPKRIELDIERIRYLYEQEKLSAPQIARKLGTNKRLILSRLREIGITRSRSEAAKIRNRALAHPIGYRRRGSSGGYILIKEPDHPRASQGWVLEHILVWERYHNKHLPSGWHIHHLNSIKDDNRPSNLVALPSVKHREKHTNLLKERARRIRELEIENSQLKGALQAQQMIFTISEN